MSFSRYPAYKDSGVAWLGEVPGHWTVVPLKFVAKVQTGVAKGKDNSGRATIQVPYMRVANVQDGFLDLNSVAEIEIPVDDLPRYRLQKGDVLMNEGGDFDKLGRGHIWDASISPCIHQNHVFAVRPHGVGPTWLNAITGSQYAQFYFMTRSKQSTNLASISSTNLMELPVVLPPVVEQTQIAAFLDRETAKIDALVAEQRRLMELLKEKRQAVISHAVTRGLNPDAPMKPSGIEWLGDVPEHWESRTIAKASTKITNGFVGPTRDILVEAGTPYIQATHIKNGCVNFDEGYFVRPDWSAAHSKSILCEGDVLIVQTGAGTGDVGLVSKNEVGYNCHALIIVAPDRTLLHGTYLSAVLQSTYGQEKLTSIETGAMHPHLNCGEVKFVEIPLPPLDEQSDIVSYINKAADQFDTLTTEAQRAIDLLQERRTALISAAVTGQIDVRHLAACPAH